MMKAAFLILAAVLAVSGFADSAMADENHPEITLWPEGLPAGATPLDPKKIEQLKKSTDPERIRYVETPSITLYKAPANKANGCAVLIAPGGGYNILAWPKEGLEVAEWFNSIGVTAAVLKYRVPRRNPEAPHIEPLQDAQRAMRLLRLNAAKWNIDPARIGMLGFSAGGHLTAMTGIHHEKAAYDAKDEADKHSTRPDFICPIYAAYLGPKYKDNSPELGPLAQVNFKTPPTFLAVTADDTHRGSQAALLFVELRMRKIPAELHIYSKGGHGYGIRPSEYPVSKWHHRLGDWLKVHGFLDKPSEK